ncbi:MAG: hypothetical protein KAI71_02705 [Candidatus Pacebacteria bacterium]|nr:hypothetical protein [Candidatus Paceibacterota bacterium]
MIERIVELFFQMLCLFFFKKKNLEKKIVRELRILNVVIDEDHLLASRRNSKYYLDIKKSFGYPRFLILYSIYIAKYIYKKEYTCIAVSGYGGIPIGVILSVFLGVNIVYIRNSLKDHGMMETYLDGYKPDESDVILFLDDVFTTGGSLETIINIIKEERGSKIGAIFVLVRRIEGTLPQIYGMRVGNLLTSEDLVQ